MPCHNAPSKEISPAVGAELRARAPNAMAICAAAALWTEPENRDGSRSRSSWAMKFSMNTAPSSRQPQPVPIATASRGAGGAGCAGCAGWLRRAAMSAICTRRHNRRRWLAVSNAASASTPQLRAVRRSAGSGGSISRMVTAPGPTRPMPVTATGPGRGARVSGGVAGSEKISTTLLPPKPNELLITWVSGAERNAVTGARPMAGSGVVKPGLGGIAWRRKASTHTTASMAPLAASAWPKNPFVLDTGGTRSPNTVFKAFASARSLSRVPVPCALTYWTAAAGSPARRSAARIASAAPAPSGCGAVEWCASQVAAQPLSRAKMVAPRRRANVSDSNTSTPAPSPMLVPARSASKGRQPVSSTSSNA